MVSALAIGLAVGLQGLGTRSNANPAPRPGPTHSSVSPWYLTIAADPSHEHTSAGKFQIPKSMEMEHEELHDDLSRLIQAGGKTGDAARAVAAVLDPHFANENSYALPPLGLLVPLSEGKFDCSMAGVLGMTDKLEAEMPQMLAEHKEITAALDKLAAAAKAENSLEGVQFAQALMVHAQGEEEITYPTALLIGLYVKGKATNCHH